MTSLNVQDCVEYSIWCGNGPVPTTVKNNKKYYRKGNRQECLKVGYGAGYYGEQRKTLSNTSLRQIKYVGEKYEKRFKKKQINTITVLIKKTKLMTALQKESLLKNILKQKNGKLDVRAYNSVILFLHSKGIGRLPGCKKQKQPNN